MTANTITCFLHTHWWLVLSCSACYAQVPGSLKTVASQSRSRTKKTVLVGGSAQRIGRPGRPNHIDTLFWMGQAYHRLNQPTKHEPSSWFNKEVKTSSRWNDVSISISATARVNHNKIATVYVRRLGLQWTRGWVLICIYKLNALDATRLKIHGPSPNLDDHQKYVDGAS